MLSFIYTFHSSEEKLDGLPQESEFKTKKAALSLSTVIETSSLYAKKTGGTAELEVKSPDR